MRHLAALLALAALAAAMYSEPNYVNAHTYTNLTVWDAPPGPVSAEGALVDFAVRSGGVLHVGLRPLRPEGNVTLRVGGERLVLPVRDVCRISISAANYTTSLSANVTVEPAPGISLPLLNVTLDRCGEARALLNGTLLAAFRGRVSLRGPFNYSGLYLLTVSAGYFYERAALAAMPELAVANNTFGLLMVLSFSPPPPRPSPLSIGPLSLLAAGTYEVDTMALGAGVHRAALQVGPLQFNYSVAVARAAPSLALLAGDHHYGDPAAASVSVTVYGRPYGARVRLYLDGAPLAEVRAPASVPLPLLDAGEHVLEATVLGDDNVTSVSRAVKFKVSPLPVRLEAYLNGSSALPYVQYGKVVQLSARASARLQPVGRLEIYVDGRPAGPLLDTMALGVGTHSVTVAFVPDSPNFQPARLGLTLVVVPSTPSIEVNRTFSVTYGGVLRLEFRVSLFGRPINASALVQLGGSTYGVQVVGGVGRLEVGGLAAGTYPGLVVLPPTANTERAEAPFYVFVGRAPVALSLSVPSRGVYGTPIPIAAAVRPPVRGRIAIYINGTLVAAAEGDSYAGLWSPERGGTYYLSAVFESRDPNYAGVENATYVYVDRARCSLSVALWGSSDGVYVLRPYRLVVNSSAPLEYRLYVNGTPAGQHVVFNSTGVYNVTAYFPGDARYYPCSSSSVYRAVRNPSSVSLSSQSRIAVVGRPVALTVQVSAPVDAVASSLRLVKRNLTYNYTEDEVFPLYSRSSTLSIAFSRPGVYEVRAYYVGNSYVEPSASNVYVVTVEDNVAGLPAFLAWVYLAPIALGAAAALAMRKIFRRSI